MAKNPFKKEPKEQPVTRPPFRAMFSWDAAKPNEARLSPIEGAIELPELANALRLMYEQVLVQLGAEMYKAQMAKDEEAKKAQPAPK